MCRHVAYIGPGAALTEVMREMPHSMYHQSYQARELLTGTVSADGYGMAWYDADVRAEPARYTHILPIWNDANLRGFGSLVRSTTIIGAVRNATVEGSIDPANCAPFTQGRWSWSLNGFLRGFDADWKEELVSEIPKARAQAVRGRTDGEWMFAAFLGRMDDGQEPIQAMQSLIRDLVDRGNRQNVEAQLCVIASDGDRLYAVRSGNQPQKNSLYHLADGHEFPGAHVLASEPLYDDPAWHAVPEDRLVVLQADAPPVLLPVL